MHDGGGGGVERDPSRSKTKILMGTKTGTEEHQTDYCPASLLLFAGGKRQLKTHPLICLTCDEMNILSFP